MTPLIIVTSRCHSFPVVPIISMDNIYSYLMYGDLHYVFLSFINTITLPIL